MKKVENEPAGEEEQKRYYTEIFNWADQMNITTFFFEAFDESFKRPVGDAGLRLGGSAHHTYLALAAVGLALTMAGAISPV